MKGISRMNDKMINQENNQLNQVYSVIADLIIFAKRNVQTSINYQLTNLYWGIGKTICTEILENDRGYYGEQTINTLGNKLSKEYGKGYSSRNLANMVKFYRVFSDSLILQTLSAKLTWSHFIEFLKIDDNIKREFYITMCINEGWSVRTLKNRVDSMLFERTAISSKPEQTILKDLEHLKQDNKMSTDLFFRDPYILDFLGLKDTYSEKDLENAILAELERFILEMGTDFAFLARQKRIIIDGEDYYIDLLFYHRKMRRLVVIELKLGRFKAEHKGQIELYLRWIEKNEMVDGENSPLGIVLCAEKSNETISLLELDKSGIHVAQYLTELPPKELLEKKLHEAIARARITFKNKEIE